MASYKMAVPGWLAFTEHDLANDIAAGIDLAISSRLHKQLAKWKEARTSEQALEQL